MASSSSSSLNPERRPRTLSTSTRRSTTSTIRSPKPLVWRTVAISKERARTGLSYVFAEPEHGSPLESARSGLEVPLRKSKSQEVTVAELDGESKEEEEEELLTRPVEEATPVPAPAPSPALVAEPVEIRSAQAIEVGASSPQRMWFSSTPSSVDDEVPKVTFTSFPSSPEPTVGPVTEGQSLSSLNPSTSRFALTMSLPLVPTATSHDTPLEPSSSWWSYVGWSQTDPDPDPTTPTMTTPTTPVPPPPPPPPPPSESAWYSPWSWYPSTSQLADTEEPKPATTTDIINPVQATLSTNPSGWASFFSSKSLLVKSISAPPSSNVQVDENGMEVMDVPDDDDNGQAGPAASVVSEGDRGRDLVVRATTAITATNASKERKPKTIPSRSSSLTPSVKTTTIKAPPLIIADSLKFSSTNSPPKPPSPAPSTSTSSTTQAPSTKPSKPSKPTKSKSHSPTPTPPPAPRVPNLILPTWQDTFHTRPRSSIPPSSSSEGGFTSSLSGAMKFVSGVLMGMGDAQLQLQSTSPTRSSESDDARFAHFGKTLPRAYDIIHPAPPASSLSTSTSTSTSPPTSKSKSKSKSKSGGWLGKSKATTTDHDQDEMEDVLRGCKRVVVIGIHGWFPGAIMRSVIGEPTGTSSKFVNMMVQALDEFQETHGVKLEKITKVPLEGEGTIEGRVAKLYANLKANPEWMDDLHAADAIIVATHSQGSIVSTHLLDRLIQDGHIQTKRGASRSPPPAQPTATANTNTVPALGAAESFLNHADAGAVFPLPLAPAAGHSSTTTRKPQRVCCLALCGIHLGPLRYLSTSSLIQPYFQYFESAAARELFEFQNTESQVSKNYVNALRNVVDHGTKMVYVASLNDQVVPIYSGIFATASHPLILRALYIDGDAYHSSDFLSNLLVLLLRILNSGISDSGLTIHLSEATAGSLNGVGHSTAYEEIATYALAVKYLFLTNDGLEDEQPDLVLDPFNAAMEQNDYEIPWSLRDVIADERVIHFFSKEISDLRNAFRDWHPKTTILRDLKRKLQPIQRLPSTFHALSTSKL